MLDIHLFSDTLTQQICTGTLAGMRLGAEMLSLRAYVNCIIMFHLVFIHCPPELVTKDLNTGHANESKSCYCFSRYLTAPLTQGNTD